MKRWPNYCPFCGTHQRLGGTGPRFTSIVCANCHADYFVEYYRAYPPGEQRSCDEEYVKHGGTITQQMTDQSN
jgi:hypothetical protein